MLDFVAGCGDLFGSVNAALMQQDFFWLIFGYIVLVIGGGVLIQARRTFK